jgi:hypothetical protein
VVHLLPHQLSDAAEALEQPFADESTGEKRHDRAEHAADHGVGAAEEPPPDEAGRDDEDRRRQRDGATERIDEDVDDGRVPDRPDLLDRGADVLARQMLAQRREPESDEEAAQQRDGRSLQERPAIHA